MDAIKMLRLQGLVSKPAVQGMPQWLMLYSGRKSQKGECGKGRRNPTVVTLFELAAALGVNHVELVRPDAK